MYSVAIIHQHAAIIIISIIVIKGAAAHRSSRG
jgi:hypothetical protein